MLKRLFGRFLLVSALCSLVTSTAVAKGAGFDEAVKLIESHYRVKHKSLPLLARAGIKATGIVARRFTRYAEYGSVKLATFEDQDFSAPKGRTDFATALGATLQPEWMPLVKVRLQQDAEQTYIYTKEAGKFFKLLIITIGQRDATAVEMSIAAQKLLLLMREPDSMGKTLTDEAAGDNSDDN